MIEFESSKPPREYTRSVSLINGVYVEYRRETFEEIYKDIETMAKQIADKRRRKLSK